jgi:hypothetical protein
MKNVIFKSIVAVIVVGAACGTSALACSASPQMTGNAILASNAMRQPGGFLASAQPMAPGDPGPNTIVGLWDVKFYDNTGQVVVDEAYEIFHDDGTEMMVDTSAPATDNVCVGVYQAGPGPRTSKLKHVSFTFDNAGNLTGTAVFNTTVTLEPKNNTFSGSTTVTVYDTNGNIVFQATGPVRGTRITVN